MTLNRTAHPLRPEQLEGFVTILGSKADRCVETLPDGATVSFLLAEDTFPPTRDTPIEVTSNMGPDTETCIARDNTFLALQLLQVLTDLRGADEGRVTVEARLDGLRAGPGDTRSPEERSLGLRLEYGEPEPERPEE